MITYQDYEKAPDKTKWLQDAITSYRSSKEYKKAVEEQDYQAGKNRTIMDVQKVIYSMAGLPENDFTASNIKIRNRLLHRLVTDRCSYSLGNGVSFADKRKEIIGGESRIIDPTKEELGKKFDNSLYRWAYWACANGEAFLYVHKGHDREEWEYNVFKKSEFLALYDEHSGALRGGVRFWSLEWGKRPITAVLYTEQGYTRFETRGDDNGTAALQPVSELTPYVETVNTTEAFGEEVIGTGGLATLPIFPLYSGENRASALDDLKEIIDSIDMVLSGFANDIHDIAQIYWLISGAMGMTDGDKKQFLDRLILQHMAVVDGENSKVEGFTQEIPYEARKQCLQMMRSQAYENYGGFDIHTIEAGATNDHIEAGYWPMDEEADAFEYEMITAIQQILDMMGIDDTPLFVRNRVSNQKEQTDMVLSAAQYLDEQTILEKLPWVTVDEIENILLRKEGEAAARLENNPFTDEDDDDSDDE